MKRTASILIILVVAGFITCATGAETTVTVEGMRTVSGGYTGQEDMRAFSWTEGTTIALLVYREDGGLVEFKKDDSVLEAFTDDKGADLTKTEKKSTWSTPAGFSAWPKISDDAKALMLEVIGPAAPKAGATTINLKGKIVVSVGKETSETENKDTALTIDSKVKAGDMELEISSVGKPSWGDAKLSINFKGKGDPSVIKEVQFFDEAGKEIESERSMTSSWGGSFEWQYNLMDKVGKANVKVTTWTDLKNIEVPFDIKATVGVGK